MRRREWYRGGEISQVQGFGVLLLSGWKCPKTDSRWLYLSVNILKATESPTSSGWIVWYVNYISVKALSMEGSAPGKDRSKCAASYRITLARASPRTRTQLLGASKGAGGSEAPAPGPCCLPAVAALPPRQRCSVAAGERAGTTRLKQNKPRARSARRRASGWTCCARCLVATSGGP